MRGLFGGAYIRWGLSTKGNLRFNIDWASLIVGRKFTVFALFYFVFEGNCQVQAPGGLIFGLDWEAFIWRGLFSEFYGIYRTRCNQFDVHRSCCLNSYDDDENYKDDDDGNQKKSRKKMAS